MSDLPPIRYANNVGVHLAYRTAGTGPDVVWTASATITSETTWGWASHLVDDARITVYDKRGTGASDVGADFSFEERMDDIRAIMDHAEIDAAHLYGASEGGPLSILFAATYPERVLSLTLYGTYPSFMRRRDYPYGRSESLGEFSRFVDRVVASAAGDREAMEWFWDLWAPGLAAQPGFYDLRASLPQNTSPAAARLIWESMYEVDVRSLLPSVRVPTTVLHCTGDRVCPIEGGRYLAEHIPGAHRARPLCRLGPHLQRRRRARTQRRRGHVAVLPARAVTAAGPDDQRPLADSNAHLAHSQFIDSFDEVFRTEGFKILKTPVRTPVANAFAERWIGSLRRELLDRTIMWNRRQLEQVITDFIAHYNTHRPHRSLNQRPPLTDENGARDTPPLPIQVIKTTRCHGLINEYQNAT